MAYEEITDAELVPGKPVVPSLMRRMRDNIETGLDLMAVNMEVLTGSGNWSPPAGVRTLKVTLVGGGGAGGGAPGVVNQWRAGGGGGAGETTIWIIDVPSPYDGTEVYAYAVGAGGAGVVGANGNHGNATTFGAIATADYGNGGLSVDGFPGNGGNTAALAGHEIQIPGGAGFWGTLVYAQGLLAAVAPTHIIAGKGGISALGAQDLIDSVIAWGAGAVSITGRDGGFPGGGGQGGATRTNAANVAGGDGGDGTIIIEY